MYVYTLERNFCQDGGDGGGDKQMDCNKDQIGQVN